MKSLIGNTPLVKIKYNYNGKVNSIYTKLEFYKSNKLVEGDGFFTISF